MNNLRSSLLISAVFVPGLASAVVIDIGPSGARLEPGALEIPGAPGNDANGTNLSSTVVGLGISLEISNLNASGVGVGNIDWRDRGNSTSSDPLVFLGEDFVKNNTGIIRLTLSGIAAGTYDATGFHMDPGFS